MAIVTVLSVEALLLIFFNIYLILQLTMIVLRVPFSITTFRHGTTTMS